MCGHAKQTWLGTWSWQVSSTCCLVCFSFPPSSAGKCLLTRVVEDLWDRYVFLFLLLLPLLVLFFSKQCWFEKAFQLARSSLRQLQLGSPCPVLSGLSALCLLYLLPNNFCAQKHQVPFFSPCHQTKPLSCPLLPAVISVTHLLNPQASFIPRQMSLLVLSWNVFYGFCECFCLHIFHDGFDFFCVISSVGIQ